MGAPSLGLSVAVGLSKAVAAQPIRDAFPALTTDAARAIAFVRSLPGVSTALVGMKSVEHLDQNLLAGA